MKKLGSIVTLIEGKQKLMIVNRNALVTSKDESQNVYDYGACIWPLGVEKSRIFYFNEENIDRIIFEGYDDMDNQIIELEMKKFLKENEGKYTRKRVEGNYKEKEEAK